MCLILYAIYILQDCRNNNNNVNWTDKYHTSFVNYDWKLKDFLDFQRKGIFTFSAACACRGLVPSRRERWVSDKRDRVIEGWTLRLYLWALCCSSTSWFNIDVCTLVLTLQFLLSILQMCFSAVAYKIGDINANSTRKTFDLNDLTTYKLKSQNRTKHTIMQSKPYFGMLFFATLYVSDYMTKYINFKANSMHYDNISIIAPGCTPCN